MNKKIIITLGIIMGILIYLILKLSIYKPIEIHNPIKNNIFSCADGKRLNAIFFDDKVELALSDGRNLLLNRAISASGARYTNNDESIVFWNKGDTAWIDEGNIITYNSCNIATSSEKVNMANPASVNCIDRGGKLVIKDKPNGSQYGLCYFDDNRACEEWAMMRGECPIGGVKTTGYYAEDQMFCAWSGGKTYAVENSICEFNNGSKCSTLDFYNDNCVASTTNRIEPE